MLYKYTVHIIFGICVLLGTLGYLITEMVVADYPKEFSKVEKSLALSALKCRGILFDWPIEQLLIIKYQTVSLEFKDPSVKNVLPGGLLDDFPVEDSLPTSPLDDNKRYVFGGPEQGFLPEGFPKNVLPEGFFDDFPIKEGLLKSPLDDNIRALKGPGPNFVPEGFPTSHLLSNYKVIIKAYTLFAIPTSTVSIWMEGPNWLEGKRLERKYR